jgi:hypothetical protein
MFKFLDYSPYKFFFFLFCLCLVFAIISATAKRCSEKTVKIEELKKQEMELNNYVQQLITSCITTPNNLQFADCDWLLKNQIVPNYHKNNKN